VDGVRPVVIYQHPGRVASRGMENVLELREWRDANDLVVGFSGAPGHQGRDGGYPIDGPLMDRWDPVAGTVGGAWDTLLGSGLDIWAADATSEFETSDPQGAAADFWPGQFSETWLYAPERSASGVLQAYRAGRFFADHGQIVRNVELRANAPGLPRAAGAGETLTVDAGTSVTFALTMEVPEKAAPDGPNRIHRVQIIVAEPAGAAVTADEELDASETTVTHAATITTDVVVRARGYRNLPDGARLAFYTNPIRIQVRR
jgi:hypothetical protein